MLTIKNIIVDYMKNPSGVGRNPQFSWVIISDRKNVKQTAYEMEIRIIDGEEKLVYSSGKIPSGRSAHVIAEKFQMDSLSKYAVRVRVWDNRGEVSSWSAPSYFISALRSEKEWMANFISIESEADKDVSKGTYLRGCFTVSKPIKNAYLVSTALGMYHPYINGKKVGHDEMAPGWTVYRTRILYQTYEVTEFVREGENVLGAHLGAGWYKGKMGIDGVRNMGGKATGFSAQLLLRYKDGSSEYVITDKNWKGCDSPVIFSEIYDGEIYDARKEQEGWNEVEFDASAWKKVHVLEQRRDVLIPQSGCKVREMTEVSAKRIIITPQGDKVVDFGQNMAGWVHVKVNGNSGDKMILNHFETLDADGNVYTENLRTAKETLTYICNGRGETVYRPNFTYQGFRYIKVASYPGKIYKENFTAYAVYSEMEDTGTFTCSNQLINQLQHNIKWGLMSNFVDVPTDCPQRDERLGWTGDAQVFCRTASFLKNTYPFFSKWLKDVAAEQSPEGAVSHVAPNVLAKPDNQRRELEKEGFAAAAWADAAVIIPWTLYINYGDIRIIEEQYESMKAWIDFMKTHAKDYIWEFPGQFGDWVALDAEEGSCLGATPTDMICTAYFAYSSGLFAHMAEVVGKTEDAASYRKLSSLVADSFRHHFIKDGHTIARTQTAQIISLYFNLVGEEDKDSIIEDLLQLLEEHDGHLTTGFIGTPYFCHVLSRNHRSKEAFSLLMKEDFPSWLYQVKRGATTIWEHWDGIKPDNTMWSAGMNSFNHYAYGAIGEWLYRTVAGIEIDVNAPGYKHILFQPHTGGGLTEAAAQYESLFGTVGCSWRTDGSNVVVDIKVPVNTTADICLEEGAEAEKGELEFRWENGCQIAKAGSGDYRIRYRKNS